MNLRSRMVRFWVLMAAILVVGAAVLLVVAGIDRGAGEVAYASDPEANPIVIENPRIPQYDRVVEGPLLQPGPRRGLSGGPPVAKSTHTGAPHTRALEEKRFMLDLINDERRKAGVPAVSLGNNNAAQIHAENSMRDCISSHWSADGLGSPMRYSLAGGYQSERENVSGLDYCLSDEERPMYRPIESIEGNLREIMQGYMDSPGHRDNILDPWHRKVNVGLDWDIHQMWNVQDFERGYVNCPAPPTIQDTTLSLSCTTTDVLPSRSFVQIILYDPPPHTLTRGQVSRVYGYQRGKEVAFLRQKARPGYSYSSDEVVRTHDSGCSPYDIDPNLPPPSSADEAHTLYTEAKQCMPRTESITVPYVDGEETISGSAITLSHDLETVLQEHGSGVYTVLVWGCSVADSREDPCEDDNSMVVLQKTIFYGIDPPDTYSTDDAGSASPTPVPAACGEAVADKPNTGLVADCNALLAAKDGLRGTAALNWSADLSISSWYGVRLGGSPRRVTIVKLQKQSLNGNIPGVLGELDKLQDLWLYTNELSGPIPAELGNLSELKTLMLAWNQLSGQIPLSLNNLTLDRLWLKSNNFTGCMPANLLNVPDTDAAQLGLPACGGTVATPTPFPTATPTPTPVPTATPPPDDETLADFMRNMNCNAEDFQQVYGESWILDEELGPYVWEHNGRGWFSTLTTRWSREGDSDQLAYCQTVVHDNVDSSIIEHGWDRFLRFAGYFDIVFNKKLRDLPDIGDSYLAMELHLGEKTARNPERTWGGRREVLSTASMLRRDDVTVTVAESRDIRSLAGRGQASARPPSLDGPAGLSRRIDARIVEALDEQSMDVRDLSAVGMERAEDANGLNHWLGP